MTDQEKILQVSNIIINHSISYENPSVYVLEKKHTDKILNILEGIHADNLIGIFVNRYSEIFEKFGITSESSYNNSVGTIWTTKYLGKRIKFTIR